MECVCASRGRWSGGLHLNGHGSGPTVVDRLSAAMVEKFDLILQVRDCFSLTEEGFIEVKTQRGQL